MGDRNKVMDNGNTKTKQPLSYLNWSISSTILDIVDAFISFRFFSLNHVVRWKKKKKTSLND